VLKKSKNPSYELSEFNEKGISSYTENGVTVFIVKSDDEWSVEMNLPYCVGFYLDRNGDILGTTGHAHRLLEEAIKTAHQHCTGNSQWGSLLNSGAVAIRPTGFGTIDENKNIENYDIVSFSIVNREPLPLVKP
jgi:hypothetical protein